MSVVKRSMPNEDQMYELKHFLCEENNIVEAINYLECPYRLDLDGELNSYEDLYLAQRDHNCGYDVIPVDTDRETIWALYNIRNNSDKDACFYAITYLEEKLYELHMAKEAKKQ